MDPRVTSENKGLEHVRPYSLKDNGIPLGYQLSFFWKRGRNGALEHSYKRDAIL